MFNIDLTNIHNQIQTNSRTRGIKLVVIKSCTKIHMNYLNNRVVNICNNLDYATVYSQSLNWYKSCIIKINLNEYLLIIYFYYYYTHRYYILLILFYF